MPAIKFFITGLKCAHMYVLTYTVKKMKKTMKGLDTVESLSAEASANLSANRNQSGSGLIQGFLCNILGEIFLVL